VRAKENLRRRVFFSVKVKTFCLKEKKSLSEKHGFSVGRWSMLEYPHQREDLLLKLGEKELLTQDVENNPGRKYCWRRKQEAWKKDYHVQWEMELWDSGVFSRYTVKPALECLDT